MLFASSEQGVDHCRILGCIMGSSEQVILSAQRHWPDSILDQVIIDLKLTVQGVKLHTVYQRQGVSHGLADGATGQDLGVLLQHPLIELGQDGQGLCHPLFDDLAFGHSGFRFPDLLLYFVELGNGVDRPGGSLFVVLDGLIKFAADVGHAVVVLYGLVLLQKALVDGVGVGLHHTGEVFEYLLRPRFIPSLLVIKEDQPIHGRMIGP